jgi:hypothetical protein
MRPATRPLKFLLALLYPAVHTNYKATLALRQLGYRPILLVMAATLYAQDIEAHGAGF